MTSLAAQMPGLGDHRGPRETYRLFAAGDNADMSAHVQTFGPLPASSIEADFIDVLESAGLTGRGGAAFASWRKIAAADAAARSRAIMAAKPVVIANGAEGEPLSFKDKTLLTHAPHLVIDGLLCAARAVAGGQLFMYVSAPSIPAVKRALAERTDTRNIKIVVASETFISGEASAVVNSIANGKALPIEHRRRLSDSGFKGRPTLVFNVETLAHMALIARFGAAWFRCVGTERDPGTRLLSVSGPVGGQILEVAGDVSLEDVVTQSGIDVSTVGALLVGGYHGRWVRRLDYRLDPTGTKSHTVRPGAGVVHVLLHSQCGLEATAQMVSYLATQSAKQCGPCKFGLPAMARVMNAIAYGDRDPRLLRELVRLSDLVTGRGACHHPDGTAELVRSALDQFSEDVDAHLSGTCLKTKGQRS